MGDVINLEALWPDGAPLCVKGREAWTLDKLIEAGAKGVTPREFPAPRWSCYVARLRKRGLVIETIHESHLGAYPGRHGRYVLRTTLSLVTVSRVEGVIYGRLH
jgi:hypothetical protein